jgi:apolipoprotein D and lipocalin family protein
MKKIVFALVALSISMGVMAQDVQPLTTVPHVDLSRYLGKWHEISRYPNSFQKDCSDAVAEYSLRDDGDIRVVNTCRKSDGSMDQVEGVARVVDKGTGSKLNVNFVPGWLRWTGIGTGDYWIVDLDPNYLYAVVSEPKRKYLWILSRTPKLDAATYEHILMRMRELGLDPARLIDQGKV